MALGAEEMVEKLTDKNLDLEEKIEQLDETVQDLVSCHTFTLLFIYYIIPDSGVDNASLSL